MFEKFTQKAIDIVMNAQIQAGNSGADKVYSEHLLLGLVLAAKGVQAKLIGVHDIDINELKEKINRKINLKKEPKTVNLSLFQRVQKIFWKKRWKLQNFTTILS